MTHRKFILPLFIVLTIAFTVNAQEAKFPIVAGFGGIFEIKNAINPNTDQEYEIVIDLKTLQRDKESLNPGLNNVARMMNLHGLGGVSSENLSVVVVIHGGATDVILDNETYKSKYELDNPNIELIDALKEAGADIFVCGQSLLARNYPLESVNQDVKIGLSMLTTFTSYMHQGFVPLIFD